jgi:hypothetical protein
VITAASIDTAFATRVTPTDRSNTLRSTAMSYQLHEDLARAQLSQRLRQAERQRLGVYVVRLARARRASERAELAARRAQLRLRLLAG